MPRKAMRDVVICLPGITGSVLRKDGRDVWNISGGALFNALRTLDPAEGLLSIAVDVASGGEVTRAPMVKRDDESYEAELAGLPEGVHRVTVLGGGAVEPVTDLVAAAAE